MHVTEILPGIPHVESPLFYRLLDTLDLSGEERRIATELHERGYAVFDFPDADFDARVERVKASLTPALRVQSEELAGRIQDAWRFDADVLAIAAHEKVVGLLSKLYGRPAFPFQTLNFPVGTEQHLHSDSIHFSSIPQRFMCGVWVAMEDVQPGAGPLTYAPGTHKWPVLTNLEIGRRGTGAQEEHAQLPFEAAWDALIEAASVKKEEFLPRKRQALIWAANLLHGGSPRTDRSLTRWSQVTHYYFDDCIYYTPAFSDEGLGALDMRNIIDIRTGERRDHAYLGEPLNGPPPVPPNWRQRLRMRLKYGTLPADFDPVAYYRLNPDVAAAQLDAAWHYLRHGRGERRRYRLR